MRYNICVVILSLSQSVRPISEPGIQCESKSSPLKLFAIFSPRLSIFPRNFASLHPHLFTNFGRFILIFNKMVLIFPGVLIVFNVSSFEFHQVKLP